MSQEARFDLRALRAEMTDEASWDALGADLAVSVENAIEAVAEWVQPVIHAAEARGREQGRREAIEQLRAEARRRAGESVPLGVACYYAAADFLESTGGPE